ncbi:MAG: PEP-CTERM sorting domain-containing protein [Sphingomonadales bacterium]|jgi:hypothetical protein
MFGVRLRHLRQALWVLLSLLLATPVVAGPSDQILINISVQNNQTDPSGLSFGPVYFAFHNGGFDPFNVGDPGQGTPFSDQFSRSNYFKFDPLETLLVNSNSNGVSTTLSGGSASSVNGEFQPNDRNNFNIVVDRNQQNELFIFTQILPSTDAFSATDDSLNLNNLGAPGDSITFYIVANTIFDAAVLQNTTNGAEFTPPSPIGPGGDTDFTNISLVPADYFQVYDGVLLLNGQTFTAPDLGIRDFILGTITIEFIAVVPEPGALGITAIGIFGIFMFRRRRQQQST